MGYNSEHAFILRDEIFLEIEEFYRMFPEERELTWLLAEIDWKIKSMIKKHKELKNE